MKMFKDIVHRVRRAVGTQDTAPALKTKSGEDLAAKAYRTYGPRVARHVVRASRKASSKEDATCCCSAA